MNEQKPKYHPVIENLFETEGEDKGLMKNVELTQVLAQATDKIYEEHKVAENPHKKELLDKQLDTNVRRSLAQAAVKGAHPNFNPANLNHWAASDGIEKSPLPVQKIQEVDWESGDGTGKTRMLARDTQEAEELQAMAQTANEVIGQYDSLKEK